jgi:hypothetical protein
VVIITAQKEIELPPYHMYEAVLADNRSQSDKIFVRSAGQSVESALYELLSCTNDLIMMVIKDTRVSPNKVKFLKKSLDQDETKDHGDEARQGVNKLNQSPEEEESKLPHHALGRPLEATDEEEMEREQHAEAFLRELASIVNS